MKKIVLFYKYLTGLGGAERLLFEEAKYFKKKKIETQILSLDARKDILSFARSINLDLEVVGGKNFLSQLFKLRRKLRKINPDIVIAQSNADCVYLYLATKFTGIPYVTHIHGTIFWFPEDLLKYAIIHKKVFNEIRNSVAGHGEFIPPKLPKCGLVKRIKIEAGAVLDYLAVRNAKKIFVLTDQVKWEVKKLYCKDAITVRGCLDPKILKYKPKQNIKEKLGLKDKKIILNIGRLDPRKRIDLLIKSFAKLCQKRSDVVLLIGGTGEEEKRLKELTEKLHIEDKVKFLGFVKDSEYFDYLAACDVFAFPSWTTSGIPPYEALAMGKNVVWTSEAEEPVLTDKHVFLADPRIESFAKAMEMALNKKIKEKINLSDYTWDKYFSKVHAICEEVVKQYQKR